MKKFFVFLLCVGVYGCATAYKINSVSLGMSKQEVISVMGKPISTSAKDETEYLNYSLSETSDDDFMGRTTPYAIALKDGKVVSYGRHGDFGTTEQPAQVIKVIGDMKSDEKVSVKTSHAEDLAEKIKTLNKLLADGLIMKTEFEAQKLKLLDEYTSK